MAIKKNTHIDERVMILGLAVVLLALGAWFVFAQDVIPECTTNGDCAPCETCITDGSGLNGVCQALACGGTSCPIACYCTGSDFCSLLPADACNVNSQCSGYQYCVHPDDSYYGYCTDVCESTLDCLNGGVCSAGTCVAPPPPPECSIDSDCHVGCQVCSGGSCVNPGFCGVDGDCKSGCLCNDGVCTQAKCLPFGNYCGTCENCNASNFECSPACSTSGDCPGSCDCISGSCSSIPTCTLDCGLCGICEYNYTSHSNECVARSCGGEAGNCPGGCSCNNNACSVTPPTPPSSNGQQCTHKALAFDVSVACGGNTVTVTSSGTPVSGVNVRVLKNLLLEYSGNTNGDGKYSFTELNGNVDVYLADYKAGNICYDAPGTKTVSLNTSVQCASKPDCVEDADCPINYTCKNNVCAAPTPKPPEPEPPECTTSAGCSGDKFCSSSGSCDLVSGSCGYAANHIWNKYECCFDGDCPLNYVCQSNKCVQKQVDISGTGGFVGDDGSAQLTVYGKIIANTPLRITNPDGSYQIVSTDADGKVKFPLLLSGNYVVDFLENGRLIRSVNVTSLPKTPAIGPERLNIFEVLAQQSWLLLIVLGVAIFLAYRYYISAGKKGGKSKDE